MKFCALLCVLCAFAFHLAAQQQLWFTPSPDPAAAGTLVYGATNPAAFAPAGAPASFVLKQDAGTNSAVVMTNATPGVTWYWTATAYSVAGDGTRIESAHCNILTTYTPKPPGPLRSRK